MKIAVLVARILLGLVFLVFGVNDFAHFIPMQPMPGDAGAFLGLLVTHNFMSVVGALMIVAGILLLIGRYVPLALVLLGPILVNILFFHILFTGGAGIAPGLVSTLLELFLLWAYRLSFRGLFNARPEIS